MPVVSVVTATYNRAHLIGETIRSVVAQTFRDFEYIIVDDGSDDGTEELVKAIRDPRIRYFRLPHTGRLSSLRNFCYAQSSGEFIAFVDSDDLWRPNKLDKQVTALSAHPSAGFSFADVEIFHAHGIQTKSLYHKTGIDLRNVFPLLLRNELVIYHSTLMVRRSVLDLVGWSDESFLAGDHDFLFRLSGEADAVIHYDHLASIRRHALNTSSKSDYRHGAFEEHHRTLKNLLESRKISARQYVTAVQGTSYSFGSQSLAQGDHELAMRYLKMSLASKPWHLKSWYKLCQALAKKVYGF